MNPTNPPAGGFSSFRHALLLLAFTSSLAGLAAPDPSYGNIELLRDRWGTPHVYAATDRGAMYGLGYATAEDRVYQMNLHLRLMQGRLAEVLGDLPRRKRSSANPNTALENDRRVRTIGWYRHAQQVASNLDPDTVGLLLAYSEGVNDYVAAHSGRLHPLFEEQEWQPEPWTPADCLVSWWHLAKFFSKDGLRDLWPLRRPLERRRLAQRFRSRAMIDDEAAVVRREDVSEEWIQETLDFMKRHGLAAPDEPKRPEEGPKFSHAWVIGGSKTTTGSAILVSDPQTPVWNPSMLYEFHVAGKTFNARGVGVPGSPLILIGFNARVAWGVTALGADQADLFLLKTDADHPGQYELDGEWLTMDRRTERIEVKDGAEETIEIRETHFGPVVSRFAFGARKSDTVALRRVPLSDTDRDTVQGALAMMRASNAREFGNALAGWRFPSANCIFGDREGDIGYWTIGAIPVRAPNAPGALTAHDGSRRENDWRTTIPHRLTPHVHNPGRGYLVSANHRSIQSFYQLTMGVSTGASGDTDRGWRIKQRIGEFLAENDKFRPEDVLDIQYDTVNAVKAATIRIGFYLLEKQPTQLEPNAVRALRHLRSWFSQGTASDMAIPGTELVNAMGLPFREMMVPLARVYGGGVSGQVRAMKALIQKMEASLEFDEQEVGYLNTMLTTAWQKCQDLYGPNADIWHEQAVRRAQQQTMGYLESLTGFPTLAPRWNIKRPLLKVYDGSTILAQPGQSYTQYVPTHDPDQSLTVMPLGPSEHPASPFRFSNLGDWAAGRLHAAPLSRKAVDELVVRSEWLSTREGVAPRRRSPPARSSRGGRE